MSDRIRPPSRFIVTHARLTRCEIEYGIKEGFLTQAESISVCTSQYESGDPAIDHIALLLQDQWSEVDDILQRYRPADCKESPQRVWIFLILAWMLENKDAIADPLAEIEIVYADFDYPDSIAGLVRYMPKTTPGPAGRPTIYRNWAKFVSHEGGYFEAR